jgi:hypothetical protein
MVTAAPTTETKTLVYNLHPGQMRVWNSTARFVAMMAGTQSGKTVFGPLWLHREIERHGAGDYLAVTANYDLFKLKMLPELLDYFCRNLGIGKYWAADRIIEIAEDMRPGNFKAKDSTDPMWGRIILRSAEAEAGLESATAQAAWLDEAGHPDFKRTAWEAIQRRLSIHQGRALFTTTLYDWGWLKIEVYDRWEKGDKDYAVIQYDSTMNPAFPQVEFDRAVRTMPKWKVDLFYRGRYTRPAGLIYDCFDETKCKLSRQEIDSIIKPDWPRYVGHDFGPVHTSALWYAQDPGTGYLYLYRTYLSFEKTTAASHVREWKRLSDKEPIRRRIGGAGGTQAADEGWREAYTLAGWPVIQPLVADVEIGIDRVYAWHKTNRLYVADDLFDYLAEKNSYSRELNDAYEPTDKIKNKAIYHLMDGERYVLSDFKPVDIVRKEQPNIMPVFHPRG